MEAEDGQYSEEFEESQGNAFTDSAHSDQHKASMFPQLFSVLTNRLQSSTPLNICETAVAKAVAIGGFLARMPQTREDFYRRVQEEYTQKLSAVQALRNRKLKLMKRQRDAAESRFRDYVEGLKGAAEAEGDFFSSKETSLADEAVREIRSHLLLCISELEKQVRVAAHCISQCKCTNAAKTEDLQDEFLWRRFLLRLQSFPRSRILQTAPNSSAKAELKRSLESKLGNKVFLRNAVSVQDYDYSEVAAGNPVHSDRLAAFSQVCRHYADDRLDCAGEVMQRFLTLCWQQNEVDLSAETVRQYVDLAATQPVKFSPLTLLTYYALGEVNQSVCEIEGLRISGKRAEGVVAGVSIVLQVATVSYLRENSQSFPRLYVLESLSPFQSLTCTRRYLRELTHSEIATLHKVYVLGAADYRMEKEWFPETFQGEKLRFGYVVTRDVVCVRSGDYAKNCLMQVKMIYGKSASLGPSPSQQICSWGGCLHPALSDSQQRSLLRSLGAPSRLRLPRKALKSHSSETTPKHRPLAPLQRNRPCANGADGWYCELHCWLKHYLRKSAKLLQKAAPNTEIWRSVQAGNHWQSEIALTSKFAALRSGDLKTAIRCFFAHSAANMTSRAAVTRRHSAARRQPALSDVLSDLRTKRETEIAATTLLRDFPTCRGVSSAVFFSVYSLLAEATEGPTEAKLGKLRAAKERLALYCRPKSQNVEAEKETAVVQRSRGSDVVRRNVRTSPYCERIDHQLARLLRQQLPPKAPLKWSESQPASRRKVPSGSLAVGMN